MLTEAANAAPDLESDNPSYLRTYLDNGLWGKDPLWDGVARNAFTVFLYLYMLPESFAATCSKYVQDAR